ncbi:MAG TPA: three-Cys-motif partner protein TcmP, partial [Candidatus Cybelea sp.]|nr:three-Cys-motif partner protein TcmP [Candidatus Cybelea sp.]
MVDLDPEKYGVDPSDNLPFERVGAWVREKHERLTKYVDISRAVRRKFVEGRSGEATFIDLYCGPGRSQIRGTNELIDGGCVAAWKKSSERSGQFTKVVISDSKPELSRAAEARLIALNAPATALSGLAEDVVDGLVSSLGRHGLHFAYLDPFNLNALPFSVIRSLAKL